MNPSPEKPLAPASPSEATFSLAAQDASEALLSARAPETRRIYALRVRAFRPWVEAEMLNATSIDVPTT